MMTAPSSNVKGPRLTLLVNSTTSARFDHNPRSGLHPPLSSIMTPSSTTVEYGDGFDLEMTVADRTNHVFRMWLSSVRPEDESDACLGDVTPVIRKARPVNAKLPVVNERLGQFLQGLGQASGDPNKLLVQENKGLHQRVAVLQRNEDDLRKDKQELNMHVISLQESQEVQRRRFESELTLKQSTLETRIKELEEQVANLQPNPALLPAAQPEPGLSDEAPSSAAPSMSNADVAAWFSSRGASWTSWVEEFAHHNPNHITELHPLQQQEILGSIKTFVRLTADGNLPAPLNPNSQRPESTNTTRLLLGGMLSNFIVSETMVSPFWIFSALSKQGFDVESPRSYSELGSPIGFRSDYATYTNTGFSACPSPYSVPPAPTTARSISMLTPRTGPPRITPRFAPMLPLSPPLSTKAQTCLYNLPVRNEMEDMLTLLMKSTQNIKKVDSWRAQLMQLLSEGGLSQEASDPSMAGNEDSQMLANMRRAFARELKERFLRSPARCFLHDQDAKGIAKLEGKLTDEIDLALRFSAQVWGRTAALTFTSPKAISASAAATPSQLDGVATTVLSGADANQEVEVVMVLQPGVMLGNSANDDPFCSKALVVVGPKKKLSPISGTPEAPKASEAVLPVVSMKASEPARPIAPLRPFNAVPSSGWLKAEKAAPCVKAKDVAAEEPSTGQ